MHESGIIRKLVRTALDEAERRGGRLARIHVRLGALAGGSAAHLREHFAHELGALGLDGIEMVIEEAPAHPAGVEITGIEIVERAAANGQADAPESAGGAGGRREGGREE